ncbi:MAG: hypothetical protein U0T83_09855 [Bacteriovoracaceae bacterium]
MHYSIIVVSPTLKELDTKKCIDMSVEHLNWLNADPVPTGNYDVVFSKDAIAEFFWVFSGIFSAKGAMEKRVIHLLIS